MTRIDASHDDAGTNPRTTRITAVSAKSLFTLLRKASERRLNRIPVTSMAISLPPSGRASSALSRTSASVLVFPPVIEHTTVFRMGGIFPLCRMPSAPMSMATSPVRSSLVQDAPLMEPYGSDAATNGFRKMEVEVSSSTNDAAMRPTRSLPGIISKESVMVLRNAMARSPGGDSMRWFRRLSRAKATDSQSLNSLI